MTSKVTISVVGALVLIGGSFVLTSGDVAYNSQSLLSAVFSSFTSTPLVTISRNPNSPSGTIVPGRSQTLAVFDVVPRNFTQLGTIELIPITTSFSNSDGSVGLRDFMLTYQYCVPKGNVYAYGYKYGYAGVYCRTQTVAPSQVTQVNGAYVVTVSGAFPIFPDQTTATLSLNATPFYTTNPSLKRSVSLRAQITSGVVAKTTQCRTLLYGYQNQYGYTKCNTLLARTITSLAFGNWLRVSGTYGYGKPLTVGSASVSTDVSSPKYKIVSAGATDVVIGAYKVHASGENVNVKQLALTLTSGTPSDLVKISVYDGAQKVGELFFTGTSTALTTLAQTVQIPKDNDKVLTIKADISAIGTGQALSHSGDLVKVNYFGGVVTSSDTGAILTITGSTATEGVRIMRSYPTVTLGTLPSTGLLDGRLMRFSITASPSGPIGLTQLFLSMSPVGFSSAGGVNHVNIYGFEDASYSSPLSGVTSSGALRSTDVCPTLCTPNAVLNIGVTNAVGALGVLQIPAGSTRYFEVRGSLVSPLDGASVTTKLFGDAVFGGMVTATSLVGKDAYFIWSPNSVTTATRSDSDWTTGFSVPGLPAQGLLYTRSAGTVAPVTQCSDGIDNDSNGLTDFPSDAGCTSLSDTLEFSAIAPEPQSPSVQPTETPKMSPRKSDSLQ